MTDCIGVVYIETKIELSWPIYLGTVCDENQTTQQHDWLYRFHLQWKQNWIVKHIEQMWYVTKTRKDNNMTNCISALNTENESELSWSIKSGAVYDEDKTTT